MKKLLAAAALCAVSTSGFAQSSHPAIYQMTCGAAASLIQTRGAVVADTGPNTFERVVSSAGFCQRGQATFPFFTPTKDNRTCLVGYECRDVIEWDPGK